ncbi:MAG: hypothetical protein F6K23_31180 [Okeania sp. SIO2C9]|nr:hypothetical protein [Okeania sp. SIO2C9]NEQ77083.1 hypothetical protein [Okeania sp. SIO2C9]
MAFARTGVRSQESEVRSQKSGVRSQESEGERITKMSVVMTIEEFFYV